MPAIIGLPPPTQRPLREANNPTNESKDGIKWNELPFVLEANLNLLRQLF